MIKLILLTLPLLLLLGCSSPAERARSLYQSGEYQQVLERYPNEPVAQEARLRLAEQLLADGHYQQVLDEYPETPSAPLAREKLAEALLKTEDYEQILTEYPSTSASLIARERLAQQLFDDGKLDVLIERFPKTEAGTSARESLAEQAYERAIELGDKAKKIAALEAILTDPAFAGTDYHAQAQRELARLQGSTKTN